MSGRGELYDRVKNTVAKLYVLRDSCKGIIHAEKSGENLIWFKGAEAMLQGALEELQQALLDLPEVMSFGEKEGKDYVYVERLIRKLDSSKVPEPLHS